ncbi:hypothetical protein D5018_03840 [Parashewanella curva]|uniref:Uncharacterized protein n=1 Tax=Parashewanella curva TaxID=2338552 RepID=A0A3L8Q2F5_9GAMM|nr:hypothetical protein [Parashewanella curva]RLV60983.1 hypothetical protein D5018_03840 [Parashewanella curva]
MPTKSIFNSVLLKELLDNDEFLNRHSELTALTIRKKLLTAQLLKNEALLNEIDAEIKLVESNRAFLQSIEILHGLGSCQKPEQGCNEMCCKAKSARPEHQTTLNNLLSVQVHHQIGPVPKQVLPSYQHSVCEVLDPWGLKQCKSSWLSV